MQIERLVSDYSVDEFEMTGRMHARDPAELAEWWNSITWLLGIRLAAPARLP